jgi:hypothetical protein
MEIDTIEEILKHIRKELPNSSKTAHAIDQNESLEEISECAEEEGLHHLAALLFEAQQEEFKETSLQTTFEEMGSEALRKFRRSIPNTSQTAQAIDRGASWEEISRCAEEEGLRQGQIATVMFEAGQERLLSKKPR